MNEDTLSRVRPARVDSTFSWHWRFGAQDNSYSIYWLNGTLTTFFADRAFSMRDR